MLDEDAAATLQQIGRKMILGYSLPVLIAVVGCGLLAMPFLNLVFSADTASYGQFAAVLDLIFGIVSGNILSPFVEGNTLQIIFLASVFGIAMLFLERKTAAVAKATEQLNQIVQFIIEVI